MGRFSGYLFLSDFDFSLTDRKSHVPETNLNAIRRIMEEGGLFSVATGRSVPLFRGRVKEFPVNAPCLLCNGVAAFDYTTETMAFETPFDSSIQEFAEEIRRRFPRFHYELQCASGHFYYSMTKQRREFSEGLGCRCVPISDDTKVQESVHLVFVGGEFLDPKDSSGFKRLVDPAADADFEACKAYIADHSPYRPVRSLPHIMEFMPTGVTKGSGALRLKEELGCHTLVALGDAMNDVELLRAADIAFCPADGKVEELKSLCDDLRVTVPCGEGAVQGILDAFD